MEDVVKKAIKTGFGLGLLSVDQAKKIAAKVKKEYNLNEAESRRLAKELIASSEKTSKKVLGVAVSEFDKALVNTGLVKKKELVMAKKVLKKRVKAKIKKTRSNVKKKVAKDKSSLKSHAKKAASHVKKTAGRVKKTARKVGRKVTRRK